jgi:hypothetical protein
MKYFIIPVVFLNDSSGCQLAGLLGGKRKLRDKSEDDCCRQRGWQRGKGGRSFRLVQQAHGEAIQ